MTWSCLSGPDPCRCRCHAISKARAGKNTRFVRWTKARDAELLAMVGRGDTQKQAAVALGLSVEAIRKRANQLGASWRTGWRTRHELAQVLGVSWRAPYRWQARGLLPILQHDGSRWWRVADADVDEFVREYAGVEFDPTKVRDARLRSLAQVSAVANRRQIGASS